MNDRRTFLKVLGGSVMVLMGCQSGGAAGGDNGDDGAAAPSDGSSASPDMAGAKCPNLKEAGGGSNNDQCGSDGGTYALGTPADYNTIGLHKVTNLASNTLIGRDAQGLYALSSLCTHDCCDLNANMRGLPNGTLTTRNGMHAIRCNCHGSVFYVDGTVAAGPAQASLDAYELQLGCDGQLYVDTTKVVPNTQRLTA